MYEDDRKLKTINYLKDCAGSADEIADRSKMAVPSFELV
jgi:hypothetical protein